MRPRIPKEEFISRIQRTQEVMRQQGLDLLLCYANEAEPQFVRYYSDYWPSFETAGVLIPAQGEAILLIGPESMTYAKDHSVLPKIRKLLAFRESSEPEYPGAALSSFTDVIEEVMDGRTPQNIGIAGYSLISHAIYQNLHAALSVYGDIPILHADEVVSKIRVIKSENEIACLREAYRITQEAMKAVLSQIHVGMTENQVKGIAMAKIFAEGGEGEAYPFWILTGKGSNQAIGRCRNKIIQPGDMVQIQIGARYEGYASTMGRAVVFGSATERQRQLIEAGLDAQREMLQMIRAGVNAGDVSRKHFEVMRRHGCESYILYGPIHGTGLMEGEYPWIESTSDYLLEKNMTFCTCVYLGDDEQQIGMRIEDGFLVTENGTESFSDYRRELIEIL